MEPFAGSLAVLLNRPEHHYDTLSTVNDLDGFIANFWRAVQADPEQVAYYADWPVNETDLHARHAWLVREHKISLPALLEGDPDYYDVKVAGWWVWGICCWIGSGWCSGTGPWQSVEMEDGTRQLVHLGDKGQGVNRQLVHLGGGGRGVNRQLVHLGNEGQGVKRKRVDSLVAYMQELCDRLRNVRVCCGDWGRIVTPGALASGTTVGIFLDPPYADSAGRTAGLYNHDDLSVAHRVREWALANGDDPRYRIVLAGYEGEHDMPSTWEVYSYSGGRAYGNSNGDTANNDNRHKERLWFSPHCLTVNQQLPLFVGQG